MELSRSEVVWRRTLSYVMEEPEAENHPPALRGAYARIQNVIICQAVALTLACITGCFSLFCHNRMQTDSEPYCVSHSNWTIKEVQLPNKTTVLRLDPSLSGHRKDCLAMTYALVVSSVAAFVCMWFLLLSRFSIEQFRDGLNRSSSCVVIPLLLISVMATLLLVASTAEYSAGITEWCAMLTRAAADRMVVNDCQTVLEAYPVHTTQDSPHYLTYAFVPVTLTLAWTSLGCWAIVAVLSLFRVCQRMDFAPWPEPVLINQIAEPLPQKTVPHKVNQSYLEEANTIERDTSENTVLTL